MTNGTASWRFEKVFNLGTILANIISGIAVLGGLVGVYVNLRTILVSHEIRLTATEGIIAARAPLIDAVRVQEIRLKQVEQEMIGEHLFDKEALAALAAIQSDIAVIRALYQQEHPIPPGGR